LFYETRKAVQEGRAEIGAANKMVRVRMLDEMAREAMDEREFRVAREMLTEVAKEMGQRRQPTKGWQEDGGPQLSDLSEAELDQRIKDTAARLGYAFVPLPTEKTADAGRSAGDDGAEGPEQAREPASG
jgi:hypothetical protein